MKKVDAILVPAVAAILIFGSEARAQRGGPPAPPIVSAIDKNRDGEISAEELASAVKSLKSLDRNKDGELSGLELVPDFGSLFGGRGRGRGAGKGGRRGGFGGGVAGQRIAPEQLKFEDGVATIPDHETFHKLSYRGAEVMVDTFLSGLEFVKFTYDQAGGENEQFYFINTKTHRAHMMFAEVAGLPRGRGDNQMKGVLVYRPRLLSPNGKPGLYTFEFEPFDAYSFKMVKRCHDRLVEKMPALKGKIGYFPRGSGAERKCESERTEYEKAGLPIYYDKDLNDIKLGYLPLNLGATYGRLRLMKLDERPDPRDVVIYESLPNEMSRVAGIITTVRQTPLSHVNLRAVQDKIPNAFIVNAAQDPAIQPLIGKWVSYRATADGFRLREATPKEVESHFAKIRPAKVQIPQRDLAVKSIRSLETIKFGDSSSVGVKAANLAVMRTFEFPEGTIPDGFAIPFHFYDAFMKHNGLYEQAKEMLGEHRFKDDRTTRLAVLKKLRKMIRNGEMPESLAAEIARLQKSFPEGSSIRCRSSTNNEDLPGFSGAGLYDSFTHRPDEGPLSKSIQQVFASLWNFRAFEEREFYRIDHFQTAMGVLVHPNFDGERVNGVAVTDDILYQSQGKYYLNSQLGEDLVTNPEEASVPEEGLLDWNRKGDYQVMRASNREVDDQQLLTSEQLKQLQDHLALIHARFARLHGKRLDDKKFAMEIEFKITRQGKLTIKQARPWVYTQTK